MLRAAVVGLGRMGRIHLANAVRHPNLQVVVACSIHANDQYWLKDEHPTIAFRNSLEELLLTFPNLDAVFLVTPSEQHVGQIEQCLKCGVHVFCEKPLAIDHAGCLTLEKLQLSYPNQQLMVGFMRRFDPSYMRMHEIMQSGEIGTPILLRCFSADSDHVISSYMDYVAQSSGHFLDMSIHDIDLMHWLMKGMPRRWMTTGGAYKYPSLSKFGGDNAMALIELDSGTAVFLYTGRTAAHGYWVETELIGTKGTVRVGHRPDADLLEVLTSDGRRETYTRDFTERFAIAFEKELSYFIESLMSGSRVSPGWSEGIQATRTALDLEANYSTRFDH